MYIKIIKEFLEKNKSLAFKIFALDTAFYIMFYPIFAIWMLMLASAASSLNPTYIGTAMQTLEKEALENLLAYLVKGMIFLLLTIGSLFLMIALNISIFKSLEWQILKKKKISFIALKRSFTSTILMTLIAIIPILLSLIPFVTDTIKYMETQQMNITGTNLVAPIIVFFILFYLMSIAILKSVEGKKAIRNTFKSVLNKNYFLPFLTFFLIAAGFLRLLVNLSLLIQWYGLLLYILILSFVSIANKIYISEL